MASAKNELQEYFQKRKLAPPKYQTHPCGGPPHNLQWKSVVTLADGSKYESAVSTSKIAAEISAATKALPVVRASAPVTVEETAPTKAETALPNPKIVTIVKELGVLIDVENLPNAVDEIISRVHCDQVHIYAFVGRMHPSAKKTWNSSMVEKIVVPTFEKDAADSCMQIYVGAFLLDQTFDEYVILTKDHYGQSLCSLIKSTGMVWEAKPALLLPSGQDFADCLLK